MCAAQNMMLEQKMTDRKPNSKLELTWIGKDNQPKLEPRILIEDPERSYGGRSALNMLIFGDNLLELKALEQEARFLRRSSAASGLP